VRAAVAGTACAAAALGALLLSERLLPGPGTGAALAAAAAGVLAGSAAYAGASLLLREPAARDLLAALRLQAATPR
jgi:hypothetical protein